MLLVQGGWLLCVKSVLKGETSSKILVRYVDLFFAVNVSQTNKTAGYCYKHRSAKSKPFVTVALHLNIDWDTYMPRATPRMPSVAFATA